MPHYRQLKRWVGTFAIVTILAFALFIVPYPVVINSPGPTFDVLGKDKGGISLLAIKGAKTYPNPKGKLLMTTVSSQGGPGSHVSGVDIISALLDPDSSMMLEKDVYPQDITDKDLRNIGVRQMDQSQMASEAVALEALGYQVNVTWSVEAIEKVSYAVNILEPQDILQTITAPGKPTLKISSITALHDYLAQVPPETPISMVVQHDDNMKAVSFKTIASRDGTGSRLGIALISHVKVPLNIDFHVKDVGGPSAGMIFSLGIVEKLTSEDLLGDDTVAGTGTIDLSGKVGPISGIAQKMSAAKHSGAKYFLAPKENCSDVRGNVPPGLKVVAVDTFDEALAAVKHVRDREVDKLQSCAVKRK